MAQFENLEALQLGGLEGLGAGQAAVSKNNFAQQFGYEVCRRSRRTRTTRRRLVNGIEPASPEACYAQPGMHFRSAAVVSPSRVRFLNTTIERRGTTRRATCARNPEYNAWVDAVQAVSQQSGVSAAEAAVLLKAAGYQCGQNATSQTREYRQNYYRTRVKSPSRQQRGVAANSQQFVAQAVTAAGQLGQGAQGGRRSPAGRRASRL